MVNRPVSNTTTLIGPRNYHNKLNRKKTSSLLSCHVISILVLLCCNNTPSLLFVSSFAVSSTFFAARSKSILQQQQRQQHRWSTGKSIRIGSSRISSLPEEKNGDTNNSNDDDKTVHLTITKTFPNKTPLEMKQIWLSYQWQDGGGLPGISVLFADKDVTKEKRRMFPIGMEETIIHNSDDGDKAEKEEEVVEYKVTDLGLFAPFLQKDSHSAVVKFFIRNKSETTMVWDVTFQVQTNQNPKLWKFITQNNIQTVVNNLASYTSIPHTYKRITKLKNTRDDASVEHIMNQWIEFVWKKGGGLLPLVLFLSWDGTNGDINRIVIPPFLIESISSVDIDKNGKKGTITYKVVNLGLVTYQAHSHFGQVTFQKTTEEEEDDDIMDMIWETQVQPYHNFESFIQAYTSSILTTLSRNFKSHVEEPNAMVSLKPPRGGGEHATTFMKISKATWLGGVLHAHLSDARSTWEQTISLVQPWTWGRSVDVEDGEGEEWGRGFL